MWILSQDRKKLIELHDVTVYHDKQIWAGCSFIGEYSTKEKVLKVLDEIQDAIEDTGYYRIDNIGHGTYVFVKVVQVYQMPQDEDVEV